MIENPVKAQQLPDNENWDGIIKPQSSLFEIDLAEIWRYRDLIQ